MQTLVTLTIALPLAGFLVNGLLGARLRSERLSGIIGTLAIVGAFTCALLMFLDVREYASHALPSSVVLFDWIHAGSLQIGVAYKIDAISVLMTLIITGVGALIHVYSIGYMHGDRAVWRFFAYLNLFIFAMLQLVLADSFLLTFLGWEGVGLCSYLLIGFWYDRPFEGVGIKWTGDAAAKAFIVNRIGDAGFLVAMFLIYLTFGSLQYDAVLSQAALRSANDPTIVAITLLLFFAATGKSAQIPLYVWLPDAMAGPTPVSALIHAATMVTSGLFLISRCAVLFALAPATLTVIAVVGATTALFAATIGLVQQDIKKVLAYSTVSQLGFMFLAMGCGAFAAGMFHVTTHAFFKALLFLGSGAVIHAMHGEQNIMKMGGLRAKLPTTYATFLIGTLAIAGIPPLAGFFSKDEILWQAYMKAWPLWAMGAVAALCTAFYMWRALTLTFFGSARYDAHTVHPHESPRTMTIPLMILAGLSIVAGFAGMPHLFGVTNVFDEWLEPVLAPAADRLLAAGHGSTTTEIGLMALSVVVAVCGILFARRLYRGEGERAESLRKRLRMLYTLLLNKYYVDELYNAIVVRPLAVISDRLLWKVFDIGMIDGAVNGTAAVFGRLSESLRRVQVGVVQLYAAAIVVGLVVIVGWLTLM